MTSEDLFPEPFGRFAQVYERARAEHPFDVTAFTLATATADGRPSARVVLLKAFDREGFVFYTHKTSRKGEELQQTERAALCFYWPNIGEQIRVEGTVEEVTAEEADAYFASRPRVSQLGAWASEQSRIVGSREELLERVEDAKRRFEGIDVPRPPQWTGFRVVPEVMEFWINGEFRLHDRFVYRRGSTAEPWQVSRLCP